VLNGNAFELHHVLLPKFDFITLFHLGEYGKGIPEEISLFPRASIILFHMKVKKMKSPSGLFKISLLSNVTTASPFPRVTNDCSLSVTSRGSKGNVDEARVALR